MNYADIQTTISRVLSSSGRTTKTEKRKVLISIKCLIENLEIKPAKKTLIGFIDGVVNLNNAKRKLNRILKDNVVIIPARKYTKIWKRLSNGILIRYPHHQNFKVIQKVTNFY